jgi:hypothetical protein
MDGDLRMNDDALRMNDDVLMNDDALRMMMR